MKTLKSILAEYWLEFSAAGLAVLAMFYAGIITGYLHLPNIETGGNLVFAILGTLILAPIVIGFLYLCFLPSVIAKRRKHKNLTAIFVLNILAVPSFGFLWIVALIWSLLAQDPPPVPIPVPLHVLPNS